MSVCFSILALLAGFGLALSASSTTNQEASIATRAAAALLPCQCLRTIRSWNSLLAANWHFHIPPLCMRATPCSHKLVAGTCWRRLEISSGIRLLVATPEHAVLARPSTLATSSQEEGEAVSRAKRHNGTRSWKEMSGRV